MSFDRDEALNKGGIETYSVTDGSTNTGIATGISDGINFHVYIPFENYVKPESITSLYFDWVYMNSQTTFRLVYENGDLSDSITVDRRININVTGMYSSDYAIKGVLVSPRINNNDRNELQVVNVFNDGSIYEPTIYSEVANVFGEPYYNRIYLEWENPDEEDFRKVRVYKGDELIEEVESPSNFRVINYLEPDTEYTFVLTSYYDPPGEESYGVSFDISTLPVPEVEVTEVEVLNYHSASISFASPSFNGYERTELYFNDILVSTKKNGSFILEGLEPGNEHNFVLKTATTDGHRSEGIQVSIAFPEAPEIEEITNLKANSDYNRVDLSWKIPQYNPNFEFVRIYRRNNVNDIDNSLTSFLFGSRVSANENEEYDPLFETNGSYFNDLSVEPESEYEYLLTTVNTEGEESEGVTIQATTDPEPLPTMSGVNLTTNENGDYVYTWSNPTTGEVVVYVSGSEYITVPASNGQVVIPEEDMVYTFLGNPNVTLQPISPSGLEGVVTSPGIGGVSLPFTTGDLLITSVGLIAIFGSFILLVLTFRFTPRLIAMVKKSVENKQRIRRSKS
ncbi:hypothetical protein BKP45_05080 [Anaerobacillus alkalidiazotrophicus]|uniref:Fibronectin type-III domain-containing protein n=1 Tax=Anaerobacillus alkalidiazotrophicus TaxID=472963 RepID=A0A1S2MBA9_9BACI|nr:hypothetical protein [Anaerobacillus alkalidiazotrophicus]OIJ22052.1 hypothetical protein BKP45_05080 [Anaerobacillus alkalidiazotrophicus]